MKAYSVLNIVDGHTYQIPVKGRCLHLVKNKKDALRYLDSLGHMRDFYVIEEHEIEIPDPSLLSGD